MAKRKNNKKIDNVLKRNLGIIVFMIVAMVGMTYAWFTSESSVNVNKVQSGKLKVELVDADGNSLEGTTLSFVKNGEGEILWEPGATYDLEEVYVKNAGNLTISYYVEVSGATGNTELMDVIEWNLNGYDTDEVYTLKAGETSEKIVLSGHMLEDAGNDYQDKTIESIAITVHATQASDESDTKDNTYDKNAYNDMIATRVSSITELKSSISNGENIILTNDVELDEKINIDANTDAYINLNGNELTSSINEAITVPSNSTLTIINGDISTTGTAIRSNDGTVYLENVNVESGKNGVLGVGGSISVTDSTIMGAEEGVYGYLTENVEVKNSKVSTVTLDNSGNSISGASATITNTIVDSNSQYGGIYIDNVDTVIKDSEIINPTAHGIGSFNTTQTVTIENTTIKTKYYAYTQNGTYAPATVVIKNSHLEATDTPAVYISNSKDKFDAGKVQNLIAEDSVFIGTTAIEVKYTNATISNSKLVATEEEATNPTTSQWGGGYITEGYAFATTTGSTSVASAGNIVLHNNIYEGNIFIYKVDENGATVTQD